MHTHTCASYSRRCNSHPVWAKPEISSRGETPGSSIAPNYRGPQTESTATVLYNHIVWEEISPLFASASSRALPARGSSKSHLNYHILEMTWALCGRGFYTIWSRRPPHQSFLLYSVHRDQTDTLIPRTHAGLRLVAHTVEGKPIGSICVQFAAYACVCVGSMQAILLSASSLVLPLYITAQPQRVAVSKSLPSSLPYLIVTSPNQITSPPRLTRPLLL